MTNTEQYFQYFGFSATFCSLFPVGGSLMFGFGLELSSEHTNIEGDDQWVGK